MNNFTSLAVAMNAELLLYAPPILTLKSNAAVCMQGVRVAYDYIHKVVLFSCKTLTDLYFE
jgi:hypothetical protein